MTSACKAVAWDGGDGRYSYGDRAAAGSREATGRLDSISACVTEGRKVVAMSSGAIGPARQGLVHVRRCVRAHVQGAHGRRGGLPAPVQLGAEHDVADGIGVVAMVHTMMVSRGR